MAGRGQNMLTSRGSMGPMQASAPMNMQGEPQPGAAPADVVMQVAEQALGRPPTDIQEAVDAAWEVSPTDGMGEAIEMLQREMGILPPWAKNPTGPMGKPGMGGGGMGGGGRGGY